MSTWNLRNQFLIPTLTLVIAGMALATFLSCRASQKAIEKAATGEIEQVAEALSKQTEAWVADARADLSGLIAAGQEEFLAGLAGDRTAVAAANMRLKAFADAYGTYEVIGVADHAGAAVVAAPASRAGSLNIADRDYFKGALQGSDVISDMLASKVNGNPIFVLAHPLRQDGQVVGVVFAALDFSRFAAEFIDPIKVGSAGYAYVMARDGLLTAHPDKKQLLKTNLFQWDWGKEMAQKKNGVLIYTFADMEKIVAFRTGETTGWLVGVGAATADVFSPVADMRNQSLLVAGLVLLVVAGAVLLIVRPISKTLRSGVDFAATISQGDLSQRLGLKRKDEIGQLAGALDVMADELEERARLAEIIAEGDLSREVTLASDKDVLGKALRKMLGNLNNLVHQIQISGDQIASGSSQVASSAENLAQGATESASSLEQVGASMAELSNQTRQNAENASRANRLAEDARTAAQAGNGAMDEMVHAMSEIDTASVNISKIIKVIDEIAFQTNLLALNAAVEAARAGQHGKGFAVVAEEVRNLAARSARAAQETAQLIEGSVAKTKRGSEIADRTASALQEIVSEIAEVSTLVAEINAASNEQAEGISQINLGLGQIDNIIQQNTASAEESAASAEELAGQAQHLQEMLARFKLSKSEQSHLLALAPPQASRGQLRLAGGSR